MFLSVCITKEARTLTLIENKKANIKWKVNCGNIID